MHRSFLLAGVSLSALILTATLVRADGYQPRYAGPPPFSWTGLYIGTNEGGAIGRSNVHDPFGPSIFGDTVTAPGGVAGVQLGYNIQSGRTVYGVDATVDWADLDGTNTCLAFSGFYVSANCRARTNAFGTVTGRLGWLVGGSAQTLLYAKAGAAWEHGSLRIENGNQFFGFQQDLANTTSFTKWGWTVGGGVEHALTPAWSVRAEYAFLDFGDVNAAFPRSVFFPPLSIVPGGTTSVSNQIHAFTVGVSYKFGADGAFSTIEPSHGSIKDHVVGRRVAGLEFEGGARYWYSTGKFQWDNKAPDGFIESRLTYDDLKAHSGELFARVDTPWNVFLKGNVGLGTINSGKMNDEDWGIFGAISYSNTLSHEDSGKIGYATVDVGYDLLRGRDYKIGPFIGYTYYTQRSDSTGCVQIANPLFPCLAPGDNRLIGTQDTEWDALRIGGAAQFALGYGFRLVTDAAYLPSVGFTGRDNHLLRPTTTFFDQTGKNGQGVQIEAILNYDVTQRFSLGVGARYWAMWADGDFTCTGCGGPGVVFGPSPERVSAERYGLLLQGSYKFDSQ